LVKRALLAHARDPLPPGALALWLHMCVTVPDSKPEPRYWAGAVVLAMHVGGHYADPESHAAQLAVERAMHTLRRRGLIITTGERKGTRGPYIHTLIVPDM
jgi:hypothetical protein